MLHCRVTLTAVAALTLALIAPGAAVAGPAATVRSDERDCLEFNEVARVPLAALQAVVPERYTPRTSQMDPSIAFVQFVDYVCGSLDVLGRPAPGRFTVTTMGGTPLVARDGVPVTEFLLLWHGSTNPELVRALRGIGVPSRHVHATVTVTSVDEAHSHVEMTYRGGRLAHTRVADVLEPPAGPPINNMGLFLMQGRKGEVQFAYENTLRPLTTSVSTVTVDADSYLAELGVPVTTAAPRAQTARGSWLGTVG